MIPSETERIATTVACEQLGLEPRRKGFWKAIRGLPEAEGEELLKQSDWGILPDGYALNGSDVHVFEVEYTNPLTPEKLKQYAELWFYLDCLPIPLRLYRVSIDGHFRVVDLCAIYHA